MHCPRCHRVLPEGYNFCPVDGERTLPEADSARIPAKDTKLTDSMLGERYVIRGFIGRGAMARVYLAEDIETGRPVAVKIMELARTDEDARKRFLREAVAVNAIGHPNIVDIFEAGIRREDGAPYLVMEFLFGEPVGDYVRREGPVALDIALPAVQQAAAALAAAHKKSIVHRDVKPDNLFFIGETGDPHELKVLDFGFSKTQTSQLTAAGIILGTPAYMAPEQALAEPLDARTDVYALGMVLYNMTTARLPFPECDDVQTLAHHIYSNPRPPSRFSDAVTPRLEAVIRKATRKQPPDRYQTMLELFEDIEALADPNAPLQAFDGVVSGPYEPQTTLGTHVAEALGRSIGLGD